VIAKIFQDAFGKTAIKNLNYLKNIPTPPISPLNVFYGLLLSNAAKWQWSQVSLKIESWI